MEKRKKLQEMQERFNKNTCDCVANFPNMCEHVQEQCDTAIPERFSCEHVLAQCDIQIKPHNSKEECILAVKNAINFAYERGDEYCAVGYYGVKFSDNTIETAVNHFKTNGLSEIWWYNTRKTYIIFKEYSLFRKAMYHVFGE